MISFLLSLVLLVLALRWLTGVRRLRKLEQELLLQRQQLQQWGLRIHALEEQLGTREIGRQESPLPPSPESPPPLPESAPPHQLSPLPPRTPRPVVGSLLPPATKSALLALWRRAERLLIENWTGILGVLVVVAGITFLAINLALRLEPFSRFLLLLGAAFAMALPSLLQRERQPWRELFRWMRSGGAALLLLACTGAGAMAGLGLQWIQDPLAALALLGLAMAVNLLLAARAPTQTVASLHTVVNLLPLLIVPQSVASLLVGSLVAMAGLLLPLRQGWGRHQLVVSLAYGAFHGSWFLRLDRLVHHQELRPQALVAALVVFGSALLIQHQRRPLQAIPPPALGLTTQLIGWGGLGLALSVYPQAELGRCLGLSLAAGGAVLLALRSRRRGIHAQQRTDLLVAQTLAMAALLALIPLVTDVSLVLLGVLVEVLLFLWLTVAEGMAEGDLFLPRIAWALAVVCGLVLLLRGLDASFWAPAHGPRWSTASELAGGGLLLVVAQCRLASLRRTFLPLLPLPALLSWLGAALLTVATAVATPPPWQAAMALPALGSLLLPALRTRSARGAAAAVVPGLLPASTIAISLAHGVAWGRLLIDRPSPAVPSPAFALGQLVPLAALALLLMAAGRGPRIRPVGLHLLGIGIGVAAYLLLDPISPLIPGVAWLMLSLLALELSELLKRPEADHSLALGLGYLGAFAAAYLLVISQSPADLAFGGFTLPARLLIELLGLAVVVYWWCFRPRAAVEAAALWQRCHPWLLEAALLGAIVTILSEVSTLWRPVAWALLALALVTPWLRRRFSARLGLYSVLLFWLSIATLVAMLSRMESPSRLWWEQPHQVGLLTMALQVAYVAASHRLLSPEELARPGGWPLLARIGGPLARQRPRWLLFPLFAGVAFYLSQRYDHSLLTLLWAAEAFVIYVLSAVLRDNQFRSVALLGLAACLLRLVAIDMAESDLGQRGLVFLGVGVLMLAMNAIYSRFRERFL